MVLKLTLLGAIVARCKSWDWFSVALTASYFLNVSTELCSCNVHIEQE